MRTIFEFLQRTRKSLTHALEIYGKLKLKQIADTAA